VPDIVAHHGVSPLDHSKITTRTGVRSNARTRVYQNGRTKVERFRATRRH
jgi:hypothetical protein